MSDVDRRERRALWDERHAAHEIESDGPDATLIAQVAAMGLGRALEVACGSGANAVWLASAGWQVTGVDWSRVPLGKPPPPATAAGVRVDWVEADLLAWAPPSEGFDLVTAMYLHLVPEERRIVYPAIARAVVPGGRLLVIGHDQSHRGPGPEPERLFTAAELGAEISALVPGMVIGEAVAQRRAAGAVDAVLRMTRASVG